MIVMIDNYDSFTFNVVQYLAELGQEVRVFRNDAIGVEEVRKLRPSRIVISPGPCTPNKAGNSLKIIEAFAGSVPIFGICLGHQCIGQIFGGQIVRAKEVMHGKVSLVQHANEGVFTGLKNPLKVTRYHSLIIDRTSLPACLKITAWIAGSTARGQEQEIMGIRHREFFLEGVQFHPESIMSEQGHQLLANFLKNSAAFGGVQSRGH